MKDLKQAFIDGFQEETPVEIADDEVFQEIEDQENISSEQLKELVQRSIEAQSESE